MFERKIRTIKDVKHFFKYLVKTLHLNFNPDNDFSDYINIEHGGSTFSRSEAKKFNSKMAKCFQVCKTTHKDIYEIGLNSLLNA